MGEKRQEAALRRYMKDNEKQKKEKRQNIKESHEIRKRNKTIKLYI